MNRHRVFGLLFLLFSGVCLLLIACQSNPPAASNPPSNSSTPPSGAVCEEEPFTYDNGPLGQSHWCENCNDKNSPVPQAPINIISKDAKPNGSLPQLDFSSYRTTKLMTSKNFHTLKVTYADAQEKSFLSVGGKLVKLDEFHFHRPGEEAIDNHRPAMVIHLVHNRKEPVVPGGPIAVAIMVEEGKPEPKTAALVNKLIENFPPPDGRQGGEAGVDINAADFLPTSFAINRSYYRYMGSLTTPGCGGPVTFYVLKMPIFFSAEQIRQFERHYPFPNARNIQPTNSRLVEQTITK
jgi:carbonic anhydrase